MIGIHNFIDKNYNYIIIVKNIHSFWKTACNMIPVS